MPILMFWSLNISNFLEPEDTEKEAEAPSSRVAFLLFFFLTVHQIIQINLCIWFAAHIWIVEWGKLSFFSRTAIKTKTQLSKLNVLIRKGKLKSYSSAFWFLHILDLSEVSCHLNRLGWVKSDENSECCDLSFWP